MHPQIHRDQPGTCPICGMTLVKKDSEDASKMSSQKGISIDPSWAQTIGIKIAEVKLQDLDKTLMIQGKVAHDPKLWVAQKEYIIALRLGDRSLIKSSEEKLHFLGLSRDWIRLVRKSRKADMGLHLPVPG